MGSEKKSSPNVESRRRHILRMPQAVYSASGIVVNGRRLKSFVFTTDIAIIRNCDADAVFAVYPFTPQQAISQAIIQSSYIPVFCGIGGGTTQGLRTLTLAQSVEGQGAMGVVMNSPHYQPQPAGSVPRGRHPGHYHGNQSRYRYYRQADGRGVHFKCGLRSRHSPRSGADPRAVSRGPYHCQRRKKR